ncbi:hypothetical protein Tco_0372531, partial [Tanacetum coccineum]
PWEKAARTSVGQGQKGHRKGTPLYSQREMNEVVKKYQEDLAAQQKAIGQQSENFQRMLEFLS